MSVPSTPCQMSNPRTKKRNSIDSEVMASSPIVNGNKNNSEVGRSKKKSKKEKKEKKKRQKERSSLEANPQKSTHSQEALAPSPTKTIAQPPALTLTAASPPSSKHALCATRRRSPYQTKTLLGTVALLPSSTAHVRQHIQSLLHSLLLTYDANMGGVLLSLQGERAGGEASCVTLLPASATVRSSLIGGRVLGDLPHVHYRFRVEGALFCPAVGMPLRGQVLECTPTYVTLTTHHILSTKISAERMQEGGFAYDAQTLEWTAGEGDGEGGDGATAAAEGGGGARTTKASIYLDDTVEFVVERIYECGGYISLDGSHPSFVSKLG